MLELQPSPRHREGRAPRRSKEHLLGIFKENKNVLEAGPALLLTGRCSRLNNNVPLDARQVGKFWNQVMKYVCWERMVGLFESQLTTLPFLKKNFVSLFPLLTALLCPKPTL